MLNRVAAMSSASISSGSVLRVVVLKPLDACDLTNRVQVRAADFADALGNREARID